MLCGGRKRPQNSKVGAESAPQNVKVGAKSAPAIRTRQNPDERQL